MNEQHKQQAAFFAAVFAVAFLASFGRIIRDGEFVTWRRALAFAFTSGSLSFGLVAICCDYSDSGNVSVAGWLGLSAILGIFSKEQDALARTTIRTLWSKFGIEVKDTPGSD